MSEYQYYEFQAIDRPLTKGEMAEVRSLSTRATITSTRFVFRRKALFQQVVSSRSSTDILIFIAFDNPVQCNVFRSTIHLWMKIQKNISMLFVAERFSKKAEILEHHQSSSFI